MTPWSAVPAGEPVPGVHRIAVVRANGIGDYVFAVPALTALAATYPEAEVTLLGAPWHAELLSGRDGPVHRVFPVPPSRGVWLPDGAEESQAELDRFFDRMRAEGFDLALQLHGGGRWSNPFTRRLGARVTAGMRSPDAEALDRWVRYVYFQPEYLRYLEVVALVGAGCTSVVPRIALTAADEAQAAAALEGASDRLVALNPGAGDARRRWPPSKLAAVGDVLAAAGTEVVVTGDAGDREAAAEVVEGMKAPARLLAGRLSLGGLAGVLARATVVVSNDSGPLHLAAAVGAATVGIYWCGNAVNGGPTTAHRHRMAISWQVACPVCGTDCTRAECGHDVSFVADIGVEEVAAAALDLLELEGVG